jgi:SAM-dependent methyltransferase
MALTTREFWLNYWENHRADVMVSVAEKNLFTPLFENLFANKSIKTTCELGGFPGTFSVYLKRKYNIHATLLDYVIHKEILSLFLITNGLADSDLNIIEADLFQYSPQQQYDLVFSVGLIEHFENTKEIISLHLKYIKPGGELLIILPNFRGINGWFQRKFDIENYNKHYIQCMNTALLKAVFTELGLNNVKSNWYAHFGIWLENEKSLSTGVRLFKKTCWLLGKVFFKIFPFNSKLFSPYIAVSGKL